MGGALRRGGRKKPVAPLDAAAHVEGGTMRGGRTDVEGAAAAVVLLLNTAILILASFTSPVACREGRTAPPGTGSGPHRHSHCAPVLVQACEEQWDGVLS